jgi:DNA-binding MarR family transcriptional regulator
MPKEPAHVTEVDTRYLESLLGYNARRAALVSIELFLPHMARFDLRPVEFSVLSLIHHNPGITSSQLCNALGILPPNLVGLVSRTEKRGWLQRKPHPTDGRALGLHLTASGNRLMQDAERAATALEQQVAARLTASEAQTLMRLLRKVYQRGD